MRPSLITSSRRCAAILFFLVLLVVRAYFTYDLERINSSHVQDDDHTIAAAAVKIAHQNTPPQHYAANSNVKVSYVTSFWAKIRGTDIHPHRREVEAALVANIHNPHFDQVVIFLDREFVDKSETCHHFREAMVDFNMLLGMTAEEAKELLQSKVTCVDVYSGQPTYYQMFQNAISDYVVGDVVVLANADMAFDDTISLARHLNPEVLVVLGTRGFTDRIPQNVENLYHNLVGTNYTNDDKKRPGVWETDRCLETNLSWDTWIFHKSKLNNLKEEDFQRFNTKNERESFHMNENGAENAALWAVQQSYPFTSLYNACDGIHSWHFHLTPKTHKERATPWLRRSPGWNGPLSPVGSVPAPWGGSLVEGIFYPHPSKYPECVDSNNCFL
jgi:hypothetical protein